MSLGPLVCVERGRSYTPAQVSPGQYRIAEDKFVLEYSISDSGRVGSIRQGLPWEQPEPLPLNEYNCKAIQAAHSPFAQRIREILNNLEQHRSNPRQLIPKITELKFSLVKSFDPVLGEYVKALGTLNGAEICKIYENSVSRGIDIRVPGFNTGLELRSSGGQWLGDVFSEFSDQNFYSGCLGPHARYARLSKWKEKVSIDRQQAAEIAAEIIDASGIDLSLWQRMARKVGLG